jgi:hypothetical protein
LVCAREETKYRLPPDRVSILPAGLTSRMAGSAHGRDASVKGAGAHVNQMVIDRPPDQAHPPLTRLNL